MHTTLKLDDGVLARLRRLARQRGTSIGKEASRLLRKVLEEGPSTDSPAGPGGFVPFEGSGRVVTDELIDRIRGREGV